MSSLLRRMQRKPLRQRADHETAPPVHQVKASGGYRWLHPTKGWRDVSAARAKANW